MIRANRVIQSWLSRHPKQLEPGSGHIQHDASGRNKQVEKFPLGKGPAGSLQCHALDAKRLFIGADGNGLPDVW